jgi:hypothetical protein
VVATPELPRSLYRHQIRYAFHHAQQAVVAPGISTEVAQLELGQGKAALAQSNFLHQLLDGLGEIARVLNGSPEDVKSQPLSRLLANPRELR